MLTIPSSYLQSSSSSLSQGSRSPQSHGASGRRRRAHLYGPPTINRQSAARRVQTAAWLRRRRRHVRTTHCACSGPTASQVRLAQGPGFGERRSRLHVRAAGARVPFKGCAHGECPPRPAAESIGAGRKPFWWVQRTAAARLEMIESGTASPGFACL